MIAGVNKIKQSNNLSESGSSFRIHSAKGNATRFTGEQKRLPVNEVLGKDTPN